MEEKKYFDEQIENEGFQLPESEEFAKAQEELQKEMDKRMTEPSAVQEEKKVWKPFHRNLGYHRNLGFIPRWYHAVALLGLCVGLSMGVLYQFRPTLTFGNGKVVSVSSQNPIVQVDQINSDTISTITLTITNPSNSPLTLQKKNSSITKEKERVAIKELVDAGGAGVKSIKIPAKTSETITIKLPRTIDHGDVLILRFSQDHWAGQVQTKLVVR